VRPLPDPSSLFLVPPPAAPHSPPHSARGRGVVLPRTASHWGSAAVVCRASKIFHIARRMCFPNTSRTRHLPSAPPSCGAASPAHSHSVRKVRTGAIARAAVFQVEAVTEACCHLLRGCHRVMLQSFRVGCSQWPYSAVAPHGARRKWNESAAARRCAARVPGQDTRAARAPPDLRCAGVWAAARGAACLPASFALALGSFCESASPSSRRHGTRPPALVTSSMGDAGSNCRSEGNEQVVQGLRWMADVRRHAPGGASTGILVSMHTRECSTERSTWPIVCAPTIASRRPQHLVVVWSAIG